jgi:hypothetical protein
MKRSLKFHPTSKFSTPLRTRKPRCRSEFLAAQYRMGAPKGPAETVEVKSNEFAGALKKVVKQGKPRALAVFKGAGF